MPNTKNQKMTISERQQEILKAVINEFMKEAEAVGSSKLVRRYKIKASPATVRHEMVELSDKGYLSKSHVSAGREPTDLALRYFINEMMEEKSLPNRKSVQTRISLFKKRFEEEKLMKKLLKFLSEETGYAGISLLDDILRYYGISTLTSYRELRDIEVLESLLGLLESSSLFRKKVFQKSATDDVCTLVGKECDVNGMGECAVVFSPFKYVGEKDGYIGVIGPRRMNYSKAIPTVRFVRDVIEDSVRGW